MIHNLRNIFPSKIKPSLTNRVNIILEEFVWKGKAWRNYGCEIGIMQTSKIRSKDSLINERKNTKSSLAIYR